MQLRHALSFDTAAASGIQLRRLGPADAATFQYLRLQALREDPIAFATSYAAERDTPLDTVARRITPGTDRSIVGAFDGRGLVGVAAWHREEHRAMRHTGFVWGVFVKPTHRGRGLGRRLIDAIIFLARQADDIVALDLTAYSHNTAAIALYESMGFVAYGRERAATCIDGRWHEDVRMALRL